MQNNRGNSLQLLASLKPVLPVAGTDSDLSRLLLEIQLTGWLLEASGFWMKWSFDYTNEYSEVHKGWDNLVVDYCHQLLMSQTMYFP